MKQISNKEYERYQHYQTDKHEKRFDREYRQVTYHRTGC